MAHGDKPMVDAVLCGGEADMRRRFMEKLIADYGADHPYVKRRVAEYNDLLNAPLPQLVTYAEADRVLSEQEAERAVALKAMRAVFEAAPKIDYLEALNLPAIRAEAERLGFIVSTPNDDVPAAKSVDDALERVARALAEYIHTGSRWPWRLGYSDTRLEADDVRDMARAAIAALSGGQPGGAAEPD